MSDQGRRLEVGVPPLTPADNEQPGQQQAEDQADPLSQNLFRGQDEGMMPIPRGESGTQDGRGDPPVDEAKEDGDEDEGNAVGRESPIAETMNLAVNDQYTMGGKPTKRMAPMEKGY